jgi:hypothetical protein
MERSYSRYLLVVLCVSVVITGLALVAINAYMTSQPKADGQASSSDEDLVEAYRSGFNAAREKIQSQGLLLLSGEKNILVGSVVEVSPDRLSVKQENLLVDPLADGVPDEREVVIDSDTTLFRQSVAAPVADPGATAPQPVERIPASRADISIGTRVRVIAKEENIQLLETIHAKEIIVY